MSATNPTNLPPAVAINFGCRLIFHGRAFYGGLDPRPHTHPVPEVCIAKSVRRYEGVEASPIRDFLIMADVVGLRGDA